MRKQSDYRQKFSTIAPQTLFPVLPAESQQFIRSQAQRLRLTQQELQQICLIARDLQMWSLGGLDSHWPDLTDSGDRRYKKRLLQQLHRTHQALQSQPNQYREHSPQTVPRATAIRQPKPQLGLGFCPVASPKTRCCNLLTLDAVDNCGYACSYCSIQSFFTDHQVLFDPDFASKLATLEIDPKQTYHIGTGQSSDSLMWGNANGTLDALLDFARRHPNVILELKSKSANVNYLLKQPLPANLICSWSLNPQTVISNEERGSAPLERRLEAAEALAARGCVIGFHLHPMIHYQGWRDDYGALFDQLQTRFDPRQVAMLSLGTLTFIKPVLRKIRERGGNSQILKLPLVEAEGKLSYPEEIKRELFSFAYRAFSATWQQQVFFYLCMEHQRLWEPVFGFDYASNKAFEEAMKACYREKIDERIRAMA